MLARWPLPVVHTDCTCCFLSPTPIHLASSCLPPWLRKCLFPRARLGEFVRILQAIACCVPPVSVVSSSPCYDACLFFIRWPSPSAWNALLLWIESVICSAPSKMVSRTFAQELLFLNYGIEIICKRRSLHGISAT